MQESMHRGIDMLTSIEKVFGGHYNVMDLKNSFIMCKCIGLPTNIILTTLLIRSLSMCSYLETHDSYR
jgi:hypothetical protein